MTTRAEEFVRLVRASAPPRSELRDAGLSDDDAEEILRIFACPPRDGAHATHACELQRLLVEFDCSELAVGVLELCSPPAPHPRGLLVGRLEADPVVLLADGRIVLIDHAVLERSAESVCAASADRFLDALAHRVGAGKGSMELAAGCSERAGVSHPHPLWRTIAA